MSNIKNIKVILKNFLNSAVGKSLKITTIYLIFGCLWILFSDMLANVVFIERSSVILASILKGLFYVIITSILIYCLVYKSINNLMVSKEKENKTNQELKESNELYKNLYLEYDRKQAILRSLINSIPDIFFYKDINSVYLGCNRSFEKFVGKSKEEIIGSSDFELFNEETAKLFKSVDIDTIKSNKPIKSEVSFKTPDGKEIFFETLKTPYYDSNFNIIGLIGIGRDISQRKKKEAEIIYLNHHDLLTGLFNRTYFQQEKNRLDKQEFLPLSVIIGDINGLKLINDSFGHAQGDKLIIEISQILKSCCSDKDIIARTGGDEFSILLPNADSDDVKTVIDKINNMCEKISDQIDNTLLFTNISLGYATKNSLDQSLEKIIQTAEDFMYRKKLFEYKSLHSSILTSIKRTMFEKSNETQEHAERMAQMSKKLGKVLKLSHEQIDELELLSNLHDIGKISVDKNILTKYENLSEDEWREIKKHPEVGYRIANSSPDLKHIAEYILCHHERWDGQGYPQGLSGEDIPLLSRIIAIVDAFDAMTEDRSYRKAMTKEQAKKEILSNAGTQFDPVIVDYFIKHII